MYWKESLQKLERNKQWDVAIEFIQKVIEDNPNDLDAYLYMNYLLMNLLVEEDYDNKKHDYYAALLKNYFDESYAKFHDNPEYLFYTGKIAFMSVWYFDLESKDAEKMLQEAMHLDSDNMLYQWAYYINLDGDNPKNKRLISYARKVLKENSPIKEILKEKGSLGEYLWGMMTEWAKDFV